MSKKQYENSATLNSVTNTSATTISAIANIGWDIEIVQHQIV